jgi:hypothetical protein
MKRIAVLAFAVVLLVGLNSCIFAPDKVPPPPSKNTYKSIRTSEPRDNVLFNLATAYNNRNIQRYDELLDEEFLFYFSNADVTGGGWTEGEYWDRAKEINANTNIFNPGYSRPGVDPVSDITLTLTYSEGDDKWTAITPDQGQYPGETWYEKIVTYTLIVQAGDTQYIAQNKQASFVVRAATLEGDEVWRIITWRDDTGT